MLCSQAGISKEVTFEPRKRGRCHVVYEEEGAMAGAERQVPALSALEQQAGLWEENAEWRAVGGGKWVRCRL